MLRGNQEWQRSRSTAVIMSLQSFRRNKRCALIPIDVLRSAVRGSASVQYVVDVAGRTNEVRTGAGQSDEKESDSVCKSQRVSKDE